MGIGIVIRDAEGEVLALVCSKRSNVVQPTLAESLALLSAMS